MTLERKAWLKESLVCFEKHEKSLVFLFSVYIKINDEVELKR